MFTGAVDTVADIKYFFTYLLEVKGLNFHPDEDFSNYISVKNDKPTFSKSEIDYYNSLMGRAFEICQSNNTDICDLALGCLKSYIS